MAHTVDAVTWWNQVGRHSGARSQAVRDFMFDPDNYTLEYFSKNRSAGAMLHQGYLPPSMRR